MKINKPKLKDNKLAASKADELGKEYCRYKERKSELDRFYAAVNTNVRALAKLYGVSIGKRVVVIGNHFEVGYTIREGQTIDWAKFFRLFPHLRSKVICSWMPDDAKVEAALKKGLITRKMLAQCLVKSKPVEALYVAEKKKDKLAE